MKKVRQTLLRLRLLTSKKARDRYEEFQERLLLRDISVKARSHHERESRALAAVRKKATTHEERKMKAVVKAGNAKRLGDKVLLTGQLISVSDPSTHRASSATGLIHVEETTMTEDQFRGILDERHALIHEDKKQAYRNHQPRPVKKPKTVTIDPRDALHFMSTGKIPVRTRAELTEIVEMGGVEIEEVEVGNDDAAAMLYLTGRNNRK
jgi:hypothetical protein